MIDRIKEVCEQLRIAEKKLERHWTEERHQKFLRLNRELANLEGMRNMEFMSKEHQERFEGLLSKGQISIRDKERVPGIYIMSANEDLFHKVDSLYNFEKNRYRIDVVEDEQGNLKPKFRIPLSTSEKRMMLLAFDMYSGNNSIGIDELFSSLDSKNREIVFKAIQYRYR